LPVFASRRKTPSERKRERIEGEYAQQQLTDEYKLYTSGDVIAEGVREEFEPTEEAPCRFHPQWQPKVWVVGQPRMLEESCPFCLGNVRDDLERKRAALAGRVREVEPVVEIDREEAAWAAYRASHHDQFLTHEDEQRALDWIDAKRSEEMAWNRLGPEEQRRRRRKSHRKHWARHGASDS
jgi:hypothetical protein